MGRKFGGIRVFQIRPSLPLYKEAKKPYSNKTILTSTTNNAESSAAVDAAARLGIDIPPSLTARGLSLPRPSFSVPSQAKIDEDGHTGNVRRVLKEMRVSDFAAATHAGTDAVARKAAKAAMR